MWHTIIVKTTNDYKGTILQFLKFGLVGVANTLLALAIYYAWLFFTGSYIQANFVAWVLSVLNAFFWNNIYVFKNRQPWIKVLLKTYLSYGTTLVISTVLLYVQIEILGISNKSAPLLSLMITVPLNFALNKFWTFR